MTGFGALALLVVAFGQAALSAAEAGGGVRVWAREMPSFSEEDYRNGVESLFADFEERTQRSLAPGSERRVGLKVYTNSGPGLSTPLPLVRAVVASLENRGFRRDEIFIVDQSRFRLAQAGFLPRAGTGEAGTFEGSRVYALETGEFFDSDWHYESPLPPRDDFRRLPRFRVDIDEEAEAVGEDRLSYLPYPLMHEVDFWINLPMYTDHPNLGVNGALLNATLWNAGNTSRFFNSRSTGPVAVAEIAAVPELRRGWVLNLCTLQSFQYIGGPGFRSLYTSSRRELWMSADPVLLDALMVREMNAHRRDRGFREIPEYVSLLEFAEQLGVGRSDPGAAEWVRLR